MLLLSNVYFSRLTQTFLGCLPCSHTLYPKCWESNGDRERWGSSPSLPQHSGRHPTTAFFSQSHTTSPQHKSWMDGLLEKWTHERMFWNPNTRMLWQFPCNCRRIYYWVLWLTLKNLAPQGFLNPHLINDCIFDILSLPHYCPYILLGFLQKEHEISISIKTQEPRNLDLFLAALYQKQGLVMEGAHLSSVWDPSQLLFCSLLGLPSFIQKHWMTRTKLKLQNRTVMVLDSVFWNGEMVDVLNYWLCKLKDLSLTPPTPRVHPCKKPGMAASACNPSMEMNGSPGLAGHGI